VIQTVVLDTGVLGAVTHPNPSADATIWIGQLAVSTTRVIVPEVCDYELRRELLRARKPKSIARLDRVIAQFVYWPITTVAMRRAAQIWAQARQSGRPATSNNRLDGDAILIGQVLTEDPTAVVATTNVRHFESFVDARNWSDVSV
jgi:predicted nucleic acid-binding protein